MSKILHIIPGDVFHDVTVDLSRLLRSRFSKWHTIGQYYRFLFLCALLLLAFYASTAQEIIIKFHQTANGRSLILQDSAYTNSFGESYQLTRLKYYVSNAGFTQKQQSKVSLIDAAANDSITIHAKAGSYSKLYFTLGVDSALNCSGAQDGTLDPLNGMFWTWNSGYIFFKMEGYSTASTADLQRIEHHVGGYRYPNNVTRVIELDLPQKLQIHSGEKYIININMDLDKYWKGKNEIKIVDQALLMTPGGLALKAADNFQGMFSITSIE